MPVGVRQHAPPTRRWNPTLTAAGVFRPGLFDDRDLGVGVLPQRQKISVGAFRLHGFARECERSCQLQTRHGVHRIDEHDASMIENPLELGGGLCGLIRRKVGLTAHIDGLPLRCIVLAADYTRPVSPRRRAVERRVAARAFGACRRRALADLAEKAWPMHCSPRHSSAS
jgi:hypothetical protein